MSEVPSRKGHTDCSALLTRLSDLGYRIPPRGRYSVLYIGIRYAVV